MILPAYLLFFSLFTLSLIGFLINTSRVISSKHNPIGLIPIAGIMIWSLGYSFIYLQSSPKFGLGLPLHAIILISMHLFCSIMANKHINVPRWHHAGVAISCLALLITPFTTLPAIAKLTVYAFSGVFSSLLLLLSYERLHQIFRSDNQNNGQLMLSLTAIAITFFILFCDLTVSPYLEASRPQLIAMILIVSFPVLHIGLRKTNSVPSKLVISRPVAFHTTIFSIAGMYLMGLSSTGFIAQEFGLNYTSKIVLTGALLFPLTYLFTSSKTRRHIFVWINKHFFSSQFDYRETWRTLNKTMTPELSGGDAADAALASTLNAINHNSGHYYRLKKGVWERVSVFDSQALSIEAEKEMIDLLDNLPTPNWIVDIDEAIAKPNLYPKKPTSLVHLKKENVHWVVPVNFFGEDKGILVISGKNKPQWPLNWETRDFISMLAQQIESYIHTQDTLEELRRNAQFAAFNQTSAFVIHDMKNVNAQLKMLNKNAKTHRDNPAFVDDAFETLHSMEERLSKMLNKLTNKKVSSGQLSGSLNLHALQEFITNEIGHIEGVSIGFSGAYKAIPSDVSSPNLDYEKLKEVLKHLVDNAVYATKSKRPPKIEISCDILNNYVIIEIDDNGDGMDEEFLKKKLFKPFETTKGNAGMGLGVYEAKKFSEDNLGTLVFESEKDKGTKVTLSLPWNGA